MPGWDDEETIGLNIAQAAARAVGATVRAGAICYQRELHLPRLIRAVPSEFAGQDAATAEAVIGRLERALDAERRRGRCGHWSYDLNRHIALMQALQAERAALAETLDPARADHAAPDSGR